MFRISKQQCKENKILNWIDDFIYSEDLTVADYTILVTKEVQKQIIADNFTTFADITAIMEEMKKIQDITVRAKDDVTGAEKEVNIEIEGGI